MWNNEGNCTLKMHPFEFSIIVAVIWFRWLYQLLVGYCIRYFNQKRPWIFAMGTGYGRIRNIYGYYYACQYKEYTQVSYYYNTQTYGISME